MLATPPSTSCDMRSPASSEQRVRPSGLLCGRLLVALVESVLRPGGWESMCRLMCHCVRHISLDNKYGRSVKAIHSSRSRWTAGTEPSVPAHTGRAVRQEELDGEREPSEEVQGQPESSVTHSIAPKRVALENRRYLPKRLLLPQSSRRDADGGAERLRVLNEFRDLRSQTWGELTASWRTSDTSLSTFGDSRSPSSSSCRRLFLCAGTDSVPSLQRDRDECIALTDRPCLLSRLT